MILMAIVDPVLDFPVDWRHDVSDFESDSANFDKVFLLKAVARHVHLWTFGVTNHSPDLLFRLLF